MFRMPGSVAEAPEHTHGPTAPPRPDHPRHLGRTLKSWLGIGLLWSARLLVVVMAVNVALRVLRWDEAAITTQVNAYTPYVYLPAYVIAVVAAVRGRYNLSVAALLLVFFHLAWTLPVVLQDEENPIAVERVDRVVLFSANVAHDNADPSGLLDELRVRSPEFVLLVEYSPRWQAAVHGTDWFDATYPHAVEYPRDDESGLALFSKRPVTDDASGVDLDGKPLIVANVVLGDVPTHIYGVRITPPGEDFDTYDAQFDKLRTLLARDGHSLIVAGDFAATQFNRQVERMDQVALYSAHEARGAGLATTYPNDGGGLLGRLVRVRLDHVFLTRDLVTAKVGQGDGDGSDHQPVFVELFRSPRKTRADVEGRQP